MLLNFYFPSTKTKFQKFDIKLKNPSQIYSRNVKTLMLHHEKILLNIYSLSGPQARKFSTIKVQLTGNRQGIVAMMSTKGGSQRAEEL